jgi:hypothetical protein
MRTTVPHACGTEYEDRTGTRRGRGTGEMPLFGVGHLGALQFSQQQSSIIQTAVQYRQTDPVIDRRLSIAGCRSSRSLTTAPSPSSFHIMRRGEIRKSGNSNRVRRFPWANRPHPHSQDTGHRTLPNTCRSDYVIGVEG